MTIQGLEEARSSDCALDAERSELANSAFTVRVVPTYRKPFDTIFKRAQKEERSGLLDDFRTKLLAAVA